MNLDQAYKILDYSVVPEKRADRIKMIQIMGYTRLRGGNLLSDCHDRQLHRVAERLFRKAEQEVQKEWKTINEEEDKLQYHSFLCDRLEVPEDQRGYLSIKQLEEAIQQ